MPRTLNRLKAGTLDSITAPGRHADGGNLYLSVSPSGARSWTFLYRWHGKPTEIGLGSLRKVPIARARKLATEARQTLANGENPKKGRRGSEDATFGACAEHLIASLKPSWRSSVHAKQWQDTLTKDAARLAHLPVDKVTTEDVLAVLQPLWKTRRTTAERLRGRIERVLDAAKARGLIASPYENPARWRGHLEQLLPKRKRLEQPHHAALPYDKVPAFLRDLRAREGLGARALEFAILTATRTSEALGARWDEIDIEEGTWTIPSNRTKMGRTHRVPLSAPALAILQPLHEVRESEFVFPGLIRGGHLSHNVMRWHVEDMKIPGTVHGFRSSFRDWASEATAFSHEVCEQALAHTVGSAVERAYRRGDLFEKRRTLMEAWAEFCSAPERGKVVALRR